MSKAVMNYTIGMSEGFKRISEKTPCNKIYNQIINSHK